jgi:hypothetical protein
MNKNDLINGIFELTSSIFYLINIFKLVKDKTIKGISWIPATFFTLWGIWNLYYYPSLDQIFSFIGGICMIIVNTIWIILVFYYKSDKRM